MVMDFTEQKADLTERMRSLGVSREDVLRAALQVPRENFVPQDMRTFAYKDIPLPIGEEQTISQPSLVAYMMQQLELKKSDRALEVGTGSGYSTAMLAELVHEVYTIEVRETLGRSAERVLNECGYKNIHFKSGDGTLGWPEAAPFDAIVVTAGAHTLPIRLIQQLRIGRKMVVPVGPADNQVLRRITKTEQDFRIEQLLPVRFVPIVHANPNKEIQNG